jgi:hypothetical protein
MASFSKNIWAVSESRWHPRTIRRQWLLIAKAGTLISQNSTADLAIWIQWASEAVIENMADKHATTLVRVPKLVGKYKQVRVSFLGASFISPGNTRNARYQDDMFGPFILDEIFRRQSILSKLKGILKKNHHCRKCEADLMGLKARRRRFTLDIVYKDTPPFKIDIEMPAIPCSKCGTSNAVNEDNTEQIICGAIAKAFESLGGILSADRTRAGGK